jgi:carbonic anhydrase
MWTIMKRLQKFPVLILTFFFFLSSVLSKEPPKKHESHERVSGPIKFSQSFDLLKKGNARYMHGQFTRNGIGKRDRAKLISGQKPHAIVLSCSDSRVPPEIVFDQKLGDIFVVRTAGESLSSSAIASIEYAVSHLGSNLIVVMGHESCGAVKAALDTLKGGDAGSPWLNQLVADLHPHLKRFSELSRTDGVLVESWANVEGVARDLVDRSEIVRKLVGSGDIKIQNALYHLSSGSVEWR